ncbi:MAG: glycosyltransferase [Phycisphaerales bacterium]
MTSRDDPRVLAFYRPSRVNGVAAAGARAATLPNRWHPALLGPGIDEETMKASPLALAPGLGAATWVPGTGAGAQVLRTIEFIREFGADVVVPNDLPVAFAAAAMLHHSGVRIAGWIHSDHLDGEDLVLRCGELADAWAGVSGGNTLHVQRTAAEHGLSLAPACEPVWACCELPERVTPIGTDAGPIRLLFAGRLERMVKRATDLVPLVRELCIRGVDFRLTIAGTGPAEAHLRSALGDEIASGLVAMPGVVPLSDIGAMVEAHDAVLLVSESEGMPNVVMEAFVRGRPALLTAGCGGAASLVQLDGEAPGVVVPTGDATRMAEAVQSLAVDRLRLARMGQAARRVGERYFDARVVGGRYQTLVATAAASAGRVDLKSDAGIRTHWMRVRRAMTGVDGVCPADLRALWEWWARDADLAQPAGSDLPEWCEVPEVWSPSECRMRDALEELRRGGARRVAIYGAGAHTLKTARAIRMYPEACVVLDDRAGTSSVPPAMLGLAVRAPAEISTIDVDAIVISSDEHERDMLLLASQFAGGRGIRTLYGAVRCSA